MAFNIDDPLASLGFTNIQGQLYNIAYYVIWGICLLGISVFGWFKYQNKKIYIYPVRIFRRRSNGLVKEINTFGGYLVKNGVTLFSIKMGRIKKKELSRLPDSNLMDEDDRIYFYQLSPESPLVQCKREFKIEQIFLKNDTYVEPSTQEKENILSRYIMELKLVEENKDLSDEQLKMKSLERLESEIEESKMKVENVTSVFYTPVPTDQKLQAYYDIRKLTSTLGVDVNKQFAYFVIGVIAIVVIGAVIFYIAVNKGDIPIITK